MAVVPWTGAWLSGGYGGIASNLNRRSSLIHGTGATDTNAAINQPGASFLYVTGAQVPSWGIPMTQAYARSHFYLLHDAGGAEIPITINSSGIAANIARTDYANDFLSQLLSYLSANPGNEGVYFDNLIIDFGNFNTGVNYPLYDAQTGAIAIANQTAWADAQVQFLSIVGAGLKNAGYRVAVNGKAFISGNSAYNFGDPSSAWLDRFSTYITDYQIEYWQETGSALSPTTFVDNPPQGFTGNWASWQNVHTHANSVGVNFWGFSYGKNTDAQHARYLKASFLMEVARDGSAFIWADGGSGTDNWIEDPLGIDVGTPVGAKTVFANGIQRRQFTNYTVYVNPKTTSLSADGYTIPSADALFVAVPAGGGGGGGSVATFPSTPILDNWNSNTISASWVASNVSAATGAIVPSAAAASIYYNTDFDKNQESYLTVTTLPTADLSHYFAFQMQHPISVLNFYEVRVYGTGLTNIYKVTAGAYSGVLNNVTLTLHAGDSFGVLTYNGRIDVYQETGGVWTRVLTYTDPSPWTQNGKLRYVISGNTGVYDDFGGGSTLIVESTFGPHLMRNLNLRRRRRG